jgi:hypothetical protein
MRPPARAGRTTAPLAGRALADICRRLGLEEQARTLEAQCAAMES